MTSVGPEELGNAGSSTDRGGGRRSATAAGVWATTNEVVAANVTAKATAMAPAKAGAMAGATAPAKAGAKQPRTAA